MMIINRYVVIGIFVIVLGFFLTPFIIGIPILVVGFLIADFGVLVWFIRIIPGLEKKVLNLIEIIKNSYKPYFRKEVYKK